jgi:HEAT repeat protein
MSAFPETLDRNAWIAWGLQHPDEAFRRLSLLEIRAGLGGSEFRDHLEILIKREKTETHRRLAQEILQQLETLEQSSRRSLDWSREIPDRYFSATSPAGFSCIIPLLRKQKEPPPPELLDVWRTAVSHHPCHEAAGIGFSLLARFGEENDAALAEPGLSAESAFVGSAAIDLLARHQNLFPERIHLALLSPLPTVRLHAIEKLRPVDSEEALEHLKPLLENTDPEIRLQAISNLLLFPFPQTEPLILQFLSGEPFPLLMVFAAFAIFMNPHPDLPVKLADMYFSSSGVKRHIIKLALNSVLGTIRESGVLQEAPEAYLQRTKSSIADRKFTFQKQTALKNLEEEDEEVRLAAIRFLEAFPDDPEIAIALTTARKRLPSLPDPVPGLASASIAEPISPSPTPASSPASTTLAADARSTSGKSISCASHAEFQQKKPGFSARMTFDTSTDFLREVLAVFEQWGGTEDGHFLISLLKHPHPVIVTTTIRVLAKIDIDSLRPFLNALIQKDHPRIRAGALEVFLQADREGALQYLKAMLKSPQPAQRKRALANFVFVDYPAVEPIILEVFSGERLSELAIRMGYFIASNPTLTGLKALFIRSHDNNSLLLAEFRELWEFSVREGAQHLGMTPEELEKTCREQAQTERRKSDKPLPAYAFKRLHQSTSAKSPGRIPLFRLPPLSPTGWGVVATVFLLTLGFIWWNPGQSRSERTLRTPVSRGRPGSGHTTITPPSQRTEAGQPPSPALFLPGNPGSTKDTRRLRRSEKRIPLPPEGEREWEKREKQR